MFKSKFVVFVLGIVIGGLGVLSVQEAGVDFRFGQVIESLKNLRMPEAIVMPGDGYEVKTQGSMLGYDVHKSRYSETVIKITLPDGGEVARVTEALPGRDGKEGGFRCLKGYSMPDGTIVEKEILRNSDGTLTVREIDNEHRKHDLKPQRMTESEFIDWVKAQQKK